MKVFITGATGYVGKALTKTLLDRGHQVCCLVRKGSEGKLGELANRVTIAFGDVNDPSTIDLKGIDVVIHLVAIIKEIPKKNITFERLNYESAKIMMDKAKEQGATRFLFMSAAGHPPGMLKAYYSNKIRAEEELKLSGLNWTIFRPSLIYGKKLWGKSLGWMRCFIWLFDLGGHIPGLGRHAIKWKPISQEEISNAFVNAAEDERTIGQTLMGRELHDLAGFDYTVKQGE